MIFPLATNTCGHNAVWVYSVHLFVLTLNNFGNNCLAVSFIFDSMGIYSSQRTYSHFSSLSVIHIENESIHWRFSNVFLFSFLCRCFYFWLHVSSLRRKWTNKSIPNTLIHTHTKKYWEVEVDWKKKILTNTYVARVSPVFQTITRVLSWITTELNQHIKCSWMAMRWNWCHVMSCHVMSFNFSASCLFRMCCAKLEKETNNKSNDIQSFGQIDEHQRIRISSIDSEKSRFYWIAHISGK